VCCKPDVSEGGIGLAHLYPAVKRAFVCSWPLWISAHIRSHSLQDPGREDRMGHQITDATVRPFLYLLNPTRRPRQLVERLGRSSSRCHAVAARFVMAPLSQDHPSDTRQLVGERSCQHIVMKPFRRGRKPRSKAVFCPACWPEQNSAAPQGQRENGCPNRPPPRRRLLAASGMNIP
jgi:hypothetical protein